MKVSIIIPYHGEEKYIGDCLESLGEQQEKDFEAIVICDGCTKEQEEAVRQRETAFPLTVLTTGDRHGVAAARNVGLDHAGGRYILFLDCDDYLEPDALAELLEAAGDSEVVFSKRRKTWYGRKFFYDKNQEETADSEEEEEEDDDNDSEGREYEEEETADRTLTEEENWYHVYIHMLHANNTIQGISVLGMLFERRFLEELGLRFDETLIYASDVPFVVRAFCAAKRPAELKQRVYIQRRHNDPINLPAISQISDSKTRMDEIIRIYLEVEPLLAEKTEEPRIKRAFDRKWIRYYVTRISRFYVDGPKKECGAVHEQAKKCLETLSPDALQGARRYTKKLIKFSFSHGTGEIAKKVQRHSSFQTLGRLVKSRAACKKYLYRKVFARMKMIDNMVVFESFFGRNYSDSPKYIYEYLGKNYPGKYRFVWILNQKSDEKMPYPCKRAKRFSLRYFYYMARAKYHVFNGRQPVYFIKRKGNVFLETWHGTPLKKLVFDMDEVTTASPLYKKQFYTQTRSWDYLVAPNQFSEDIFRHAFMYDGKMLQTGYPRNDILYLQDEEREKLTQEIKKELGIDPDKKVILYAPTWRDDEFYDHAQYKFTLKLDMAKMQKEIGDEYVLLLRTHYFIVDFLDLTPYSGFAYNVSKYNDIARLYLISDVLITDYSSVFFDYANLRRPMLFFTYDLDKYQSVLRGFYMDVEEELPGPMLFDTDEVLDAIRNLAQIEKQYEDKYRLFCEKYCGWEDGSAAKKVVETVFDK